jgi:hypothetical protein
MDAGAAVWGDEPWFEVCAWVCEWSWFCCALSYLSLCLDHNREHGCLENGYRSNSLARESGSGVKGCGALVLADRFTPSP